MRIVIGGGPRTGKTTISRQLGWPVKHTDDLIKDHNWSDASAKIADEWMRVPGPWVIEGVATVRALRKYFARYPDEKPCDVLLWCDVSRVTRTKGQRALGVGCNTVFRDIVPELQRRVIPVVFASASAPEFVSKYGAQHSDEMVQ